MNKGLLFKKIRIILKDNKVILFISFFWFLGGFLIYFLVFRLNIPEAIKASFFCKNIENDFSSAYVIWSQGIIFGVIFSFFTQNVLAKYLPERSCRMIAREIENHIVIIGYTHLGMRLVSHFKANKIPYCLIEKDKEKIDELLRAGDPVIVDDAREQDALEDANIDKSKVVIIASNNLETALLVTKRARQINKDCRIITRCFQDEFAEIIESLGANEVISSSKNAFEDIVKNL